MTPGSGETWLFDLGNSRLKAARLERCVPIDVTALDWDRPDLAVALRRELARWPRPERVWVASVASTARAAQLRDALATLAPGRVEWPTTPRRAGGVVNRYARPERLGIDRFMAMLAARARAAGACIVAGCGTALTLDALAADGSHADGLITLSPTGMLRALHDATAISDRNADAFAERPGDDTAAALRAGCWASAGALLEWFAARCRSRHAVERIWLHGGWAAQLKDWLARDGCRAEILEDAVLRGLAVWAAEAHVESSAGER